MTTSGDAGGGGRDPDGCGPTPIGESRTVSFPSRVAETIDHTALKPETTEAAIDRLCQEAEAQQFASVCVNGCWVPRCVSRLRGAGISVGTVVGFPLGAGPSSSKITETEVVVAWGADEVDMVAPIGHMLGNDWAYVARDIRGVVDAAGGRVVKVILETAVLDRRRIGEAAEIVVDSGASYVKTSTGFHPAGGATEDAVSLLVGLVRDAVGVKASGGIRDCRSVLRMLAAGATRIGTSSGVGLSECLDADPRPLAELVADPARHDPVCHTASRASP